MYNGHANEDSYYFDVVWSNNAGLYEAFKNYARLHPRQSPQTLGRNVKDAVSAALNNGGWGYAGMPDWLRSLPWHTWRDVHETVSDMRNVNETELGLAIIEALETE